MKIGHWLESLRWQRKDSRWSEGGRLKSTHLGFHVQRRMVVGRVLFWLGVKDRSQSWTLPYEVKTKSDPTIIKGEAPPGGGRLIGGWEEGKIDHQWIDQKLPVEKKVSSLSRELTRGQVRCHLQNRYSRGRLITTSMVGSISYLRYMDPT